MKRYITYDTVDKKIIGIDCDVKTALSNLKNKKGGVHFVHENYSKTFSEECLIRMEKYTCRYHIIPITN